MEEEERHSMFLLIYWSQLLFYMFVFKWKWYVQWRWKETQEGSVGTNRAPAVDLERGDCVRTGVSRHGQQKRVRLGQNAKLRVCRNVIKKTSYFVRWQKSLQMYKRSGVWISGRTPPWKCTRKIKEVTEKTKNGATVDLFLKSSQLVYIWECSETAPLNPEFSQNTEGQSREIGLANIITSGILFLSIYQLFTNHFYQS